MGHLSPAAGSAHLRAVPVDDLRPREREILTLLADGASDRAIAARLNLAPETVRWYNKQLYGKLGVTSRGEAVQRATELGLLLAPEPARGPVPRTPIRYTDHGGVSIAWQAIGSGPVDLLFISGFISHIELQWEEPGYAEFLDALGRHARVLMFDKRGVGLSDRTHPAPSLEQTIGDARAVMRAAGSTRAFVAGTSEGGAAAVLLASMHPELVHGLVLVSTTPLVARRGDEPAWSREWHDFERTIQEIQRTWGDPWAVERFAPSRLNDPAFASWWSRTLRGAASPATARAVMERAREVDIRALLPQVHARTLVLHRTGDRVVDVGAGRYLATRLPNAHLEELPGDDHLYFVDPLPLAHAIARFIGGPRVAPPAESFIAIVLRMTGTGAALEGAQREVLEGAQPRHSFTSPGGWTACFDSPDRAVQCARELAALGRGRVGGMALHVGACRTSDGAPAPAVHETSERLAALAEPGEVLLSTTLHDILSGSGLELQARSIDTGDGTTPPATVWRLRTA